MPTPKNAYDEMVYAQRGRRFKLMGEGKAERELPSFIQVLNPALSPSKASERECLIAVLTFSDDFRYLGPMAINLARLKGYSSSVSKEEHKKLREALARGEESDLARIT